MSQKLYFLDPNQHQEDLFRCWRNVLTFWRLHLEEMTIFLICKWLQQCAAASAMLSSVQQLKAVSSHYEIARGIIQTDFRCLEMLLCVRRSILLGCAKLSCQVNGGIARCQDDPANLLSTPVILSSSWIYFHSATVISCTTRPPSARRCSRPSPSTICTRG